MVLKKMVIWFCVSIWQNNIKVFFIMFFMSLLLTVGILTVGWTPLIGKDLNTRIDESVKTFYLNKVRQRSYPNPITGDTVFSYKRYVGEDVKFICNVKIGFYDSKPHVNQVIWKRNGQMLYVDDRLIINSTFYRLSDDKYQVVSNLSIYSITKNEFGTYHCFISNYIYTKKKTKQSKCKRMKPSGRRADQCSKSPFQRHPEWTYEDIERMFYQYYFLKIGGEYRLVEDVPRLKRIYITPGSLLCLNISFYHLHNQDIFKAVLSKAGENASLIKSKCSFIALGVHLLREIFNLVGYNFKLGDVYLENETHTFGISSSAFLCRCISPDMYGLYSITIYSKVFNESIQRWSTETIHYPQTIDIRPQSTLFTQDDPSQTDDIRVQFEEDCWTRGGDRHESCKYAESAVLEMYRSINVNEKYLICKCFLVCLCVFCIMRLFIYFIPSIYNKFNKTVHSIRQLPCVTNFANLKMQYAIQFHIYISSTEEERSFVTEVLMPILMQHGLKVFYNQQDILPGRHYLIESAQAINKSLAFIVLASRSFIDNEVMNTYEICHILNRSSKEHLLIINLDDYDINSVFAKYYTVINCDRLVEDPLFDSLRNWMRNIGCANAVCVCIALSR